MPRNTKVDVITDEDIFLHHHMLAKLSGSVVVGRWRGPRLGPFFTARLSPSRQQDHYPWGGVHWSLTSSSRMVVPLLTTTSRMSPPFTWRSTCVVGWRSSSRPHWQDAQSLPSRTHLRPVSHKRNPSPPRTTILRPARQVRLRLVHGPRRTAQASPPTQVGGRISTSRGNNNWRPCRRPAPARALMQAWPTALPSHHHHLPLCRTQDSARGTQEPSTTRTDPDLGSGVAS
jgi:hypothetical protein